MTTSENISNSISEQEAQALSVSAAQAVVRRWSQSVTTIERVALRDSLSRVLGEDVISPIDVPSHDNAAMDGYAFDGAALEEITQSTRGTDQGGARELSLVVAGAALAGHPFTGKLSARQCVRIMTGAAMPADCDTVVAQELVTLADEHIVFDARRIARGANCRQAGEDLARGRPALAAGRVVRPSDVGLLASLGIADVAVRRRLRVAFFSTGDELRSIGEPLPPGCVFDSNRYTLSAMLAKLQVDALDLGIVRDEPAALEAAFRSAAQCADVVLSSGGVSVGEADFTRRMFETLGDVAFWQLAMRPGRPLAFGRLWPNGEKGRKSGERPTLYFGLPGNPVAVMVTFYQIVREALLAMSGARPCAALQLTAIATAALKKRPGRTEYLRGIASRDENGSWRVAPTRSQSSGALSSMSEGNCFIVLAHEQGDVAAGERVDIMPFEGLI
jgi:molybdopterin molybdotransferase